VEQQKVLIFQQLHLTVSFILELRLEVTLLINMLVHQSYPVATNHLNFQHVWEDEYEVVERNAERLRFQQSMMRQHLHQRMLLLNRQGLMGGMRGGRPCDVPPRMAKNLQYYPQINHSNFINEPHYGQHIIQAVYAKKPHEHNWDLSSFKFRVGKDDLKNSCLDEIGQNAEPPIDDPGLEECLNHVYQKVEEVLTTHAHASRMAEYKEKSIQSFCLPHK